MSKRVVIVTGGTRGVGLGITKEFLAHGDTVVVCGRNLPEPPIAVDGNEAHFIAADVRDIDHISAVVDQTVENYGQLDILINNAGGSPPAESASVSPRFSEAIIKLNLLAPLWFSQKVYGVMSTQDSGGSIINIASVSGLRASPGTAAYGAAKAGLINLTKTLAIEWGPKVRVNAIAAGPVETESSELHYGSAAGVARVAETIPMQRLALPRDVANLCLFFASDAAAYVTGSCMMLDGGGERPAFLDAVEDASKNS
jgi:NAD(P)-dependent dehydrogenase (short-subunit alcohol dehydrogenase family)